MRKIESATPFWGWRVVAAAFTSNFMATGSAFYIFNALMLPLCQTHGWSRAELNYAPMLGFGLGLISQVIYGTFVGVVGPRRLMAIGPIVSAAAFIMLGQVDGLLLFYGLFVVLVWGNGAMNGIVANTAVSNWFGPRLGSAMGLAAAGISLSGAVLPYAAMVILESSDLPTTFLAVGLFILLGAPLNWLLVRDSPEAVGQYVDGQPPEQLASDAAATPPPPGESLAEAMAWTPARIMREPSFWKVGVSYAFSTMGVVGVMFQLGPRMRDVGFDNHTAMLLMSATALAGTAGKYLWGMICDRLDTLKVVACLNICNVVGLALGLVPGGMAISLAFVLVFGFAMGGIMSTFPIVARYLYGRLAFARVFRFMALFLALEGVGSIIMGHVFEYTGSYDWAFVIFIVLDVVAAGLVLWAKKPAPMAA